MRIFDFFLFTFLFSSGVDGQIECEFGFCKNGGTCQSNGWIKICKCFSEWTGQKCQLRKKDTTPVGTLPACPTSAPSICDILECVVDQECAVGERCCIGACHGQQCYKVSALPRCRLTDWSGWSACSPLNRRRSCGQGRGTRYRTKDVNLRGVPVTKSALEAVDRDCETNEEYRQEESCSLGPCPPCLLTQWTAWSACSVSCGFGGFKTRSRQGINDGSCQYSWSRGDLRDRVACSGPACFQRSRLPCVDPFKRCARYGEASCKAASGYLGSKTTTLSGLRCQRWDRLTPHDHKWTSLANSHNYCRNPNSNTAPWCYTVSQDVRWEYCFSDCDPTPCRDKQTPEVCSTYALRGACNPANKNYYIAFTNCCMTCKLLKNSQAGKGADSRCNLFAKEGRCEAPGIRNSCSHICHQC